jgi:hypothetical protein
MSRCGGPTALRFAAPGLVAIYGYDQLRRETDWTLKAQYVGDDALIVHGQERKAIW